MESTEGIKMHESMADTHETNFEKPNNCNGSLNVHESLTTTVEENTEQHISSKDSVTVLKPMSEVLKTFLKKRKMDSKDGLREETILQPSSETMKDDHKKRSTDTKDCVDKETKTFVKENVLINVNRPDGEPDIYLNKSIAEIVKPHQICGIRFIFDKIIGSLEKFKDSENDSGCVLAHGMGLGKTLQTIAFCDLLFRYTSCTKVICITPVSTIKNWKLEFDKYLPPKGESPRMFEVYAASEKRKSRIRIIKAWSTNGGELLIDYEMFRTEVNKTENQDNIRSCLLAAELLICDEGHRIKNYNSDTLASLTKLNTKRKIILTGYPLQNNLLEYWCMINFIKHNYLGSIPEFIELFKSPIEKGQFIDSTIEEKKLMNYRTFVLHSLLSNFVQRENSLLHHLPPKHDFVLFIKMTSFQKDLYKSFSNIRAAKNVLASFAMSIKILNHADILFNFLMSQSNKSSAATNVQTIDKSTENPSTKEQTETNSETWASELMKDYKNYIIENSTKMEIVLCIMKECINISDRIVLFSQSLASLNLIECFIQSEFNWKKTGTIFALMALPT